MHLYYIPNTIITSAKPAIISTWYMDKGPGMKALQWIARGIYGLIQYKIWK